MSFTLNALSVDVEEYFHASAIGAAFKRRGDTPESRCEASVRQVMSILDECGQKATFFTLGSIAERLPGLIKDVAAQGHEIGCHGWDHRAITHMSLAEFEEDVSRASSAIEGASGVRPIGYRAPTFSLSPDRLPYLKALRDMGFMYDSSVFPTLLAGLKMESLPRAPWTVMDGLIEAPVAVAQYGPFRVPVGGGVFFRSLPYHATRRGIQNLNRSGYPAVMYFHPWEFDPEQPRVKGVSPVSYLRHYIGLSHTEPRFRQLCRDFRFSTVACVLGLRPN